MIVKESTKGLTSMGEGVRRRNLAYGEKTHMVKFFLEKGSSVEIHSHEAEQTGYLVSGKITLAIQGSAHDMQTGDSWSIPGGYPHAAYVSEDSVIIEVFSPPRKDYLE